MRWRIIIILATVTLWTVCVDVCPSADLQSSASSRPNIVWIMAEDISTELGCYGHPTIHTPHLDRMAAEGIKLTQFYSAAPVCTPSRAASKASSPWPSSAAIT